MRARPAAFRQSRPSVYLWLTRLVGAAHFGLFDGGAK